MKVLFILSVLVIGALAKDQTGDDKNIGHVIHDTDYTNVHRFGDLAMLKIANRLNKFNFDENQKHVIDDFLVQVDRYFKNCNNDYRYKQCVGTYLGRIMHLISDLDRFGFDRFYMNWNNLRGNYGDNVNRDVWNRDYLNRDNLNVWNRDNLGRGDFNRDFLNRDYNRDYLNLNRDTFHDTGRFGVYDVDRDTNVRGISNRYDVFDFNTDHRDTNWNQDVTGRYPRDVFRTDDLNKDLGYLGVIVYGVGVDRDINDRVGHNIGDNWNRYGDIDYYGHGKNLYNKDRFRNVWGGQGYTDVDRDIHGRYGGDRDVFGHRDLNTDSNIYGRDHLQKYGGDRDIYGDYGRRGLNVGRNVVGTDNIGWGDRRNLYFGLRDGYDRDVQTK